MYQRIVLFYRREFESIRLSEKFLSFYKVKIIDERQFLFYIILLN